MSLRLTQLSHRGGFTALLAMLLVMPLGTASAASSNPGGADFDIPISELKKVKKKAPAKRATSDGKKKKKSAAKPQEPSSASASAAAAEPAGQAVTSPVVSSSSPQLSPASAEPVSGSEEVRIHHTPYSFVVAGKRTEIHAVISSKDDIREVNCNVGAAEGGANNPVKMEKVSGTRFTYRANLPPLPSGTENLSYTIDAVDSQGRNIRSRMFVTPVTASPVVPSWQLENAGEAVSTVKEDEKTPLKDSTAPELPK